MKRMKFESNCSKANLIAYLLVMQNKVNVKKRTKFKNCLLSNELEN